MKNGNHRKDGEAPVLRVVSYGLEAEDVLAGVHPPVAPAVEKQARQAIRVETERVRQRYKEVECLEFRQAETREQLAGALWEKARALVTEAEQNLAACPPGSFATGLVALACFAACFGAEYVFNAAVLPWLLNLRPGSVLAVALGIAPATAPVVLHCILPRLFQLEDPAARAVAAASASRTAHRIVTVLFLLGVVVSTIGSIYLVAGCREVASILANRETVTEITAAQHQVIRWAIVALSVVLCINGALFYLYGASEVRRWWTRDAAKRGLAGLRKKSDAAREAHGATVAELAPRRAEWECVEEGAARAAEAFEARKLLQLAAMVEQPEPQLCSWARVNELLDRNARSRPAGAPELVRSVSA
ncbi:MAG: hypothetical protein ABSH44_04990 [Bryobacteraceae bacterium]|jgi:hypothetical protein